MDYSIVSVFSNLEEFEKECQKKVADGFTPTGGVSVITYQGFKPQFIQAFLRDNMLDPTIVAAPLSSPAKCNVTDIEDYSNSAPVHQPCPDVPTKDRVDERSQIPEPAAITKKKRQRQKDK